MEEGQLRCSDSDFWILNSVEELRVLIASQFLQVELQTGRAIHRKDNVKVTPSQTHCLVVWDRCQAGCKSKDSQWGADLLLGTEGRVWCAFVGWSERQHPCPMLFPPVTPTREELSITVKTDTLMAVGYQLMWVTLVQWRGRSKGLCGELRDFAGWHLQSLSFQQCGLGKS